MAKRQIAISIDEDLLARVDRVADLREDSRSAMIEKFVQLGIEEQERLVGDKDATVMQLVALRLMESPRFLQKMCQIFGEEITDTEVDSMKERAAKVRRARERVRKERNQGG